MTGMLDTDFLPLVYSDEGAPEGANPVLQILSVKKINANSTAPNGPADRYRLILSDGNHFCQAMLAVGLNPMVDNHDLDKHVLIRLKSFSINAVQGRKLIILLALEIVQGGSGEKIGNPVTMEGPAAAAGAGAAAAVPGGARGGASNGRPKQETVNRGQQRGGARPGGGKDMGPLFPIEALSPYQNKWTIKARVTAKSEIKHWSNQRGDGKLFNVTLMDETGEIRATGFNEAVDNFYEVFEEGKVYFLSKARINIAKKQFNNVQNEYEIALTNDSEVEPCDDESVPQIKYAFKRVDELAELNKDDLCDIIGVVHEVMDMGSVTSKATQKPFAKRDITLVDQSGHAVRLTLWGKQAETFSHGDAPVIAFKGVKVGDYGGRSLSMFSTATMNVNPDINEAHALRGWYDSAGQHTTFQAYSNSSATRSDNTAIRPNEIKTIGEAKDENLGMRDKVDYFTTSAVVAFIKSENFSYPACANPDGCNKKVVENGDGAWICDKCDKTWPAPIHRYILNMNCMDHTSSFWITAFNETAEKLLGISANDLMKLKDEGDESGLSSHFSKAAGRTYTFEMMAKQDSYNEQVRVRYTARKAALPDFVAESAYLTQQISQFKI